LLPFCCSFALSRYSVPALPTIHSDPRRRGSLDSNNVEPSLADGARAGLRVLDRHQQAVVAHLEPLEPDGTADVVHPAVRRLVEDEAHAFVLAGIDLPDGKRGLIGAARLQAERLVVDRR